MATVSLCMIVRNEEDVLARCLSSVADLVDEIIIADTGSSDRTPEIAAEMGAKVVHFLWIDDFSAARNFAFSHAKCDYQLWLDADDVLEGENRERFRRIKANLTADVVMLPYHIAFDADGKPLFTFYRERLLRREAGFRWEGAVHECITPRGEIIYGDAAISHRKEKQGDSCRNLRIYQKLLAQGHKFSARELYYYGRELADHSACRAAVGIFEKFLDHPDAWQPDCIEACLRMGDCLHRLGEPLKGRNAILQSLGYGVSSEACCRLGGFFLNQQQYEQAVFWYEAALHAPKGTGFRKPDYERFIPALQLCVCYDRMGRPEQAYQFHQRAYAEHPQHPACQYNQQYFEKKQQEKFSAAERSE